MLSTTHLLPPGKYFIGDPSYVLDRHWPTIAQNAEFDMPIRIGEFFAWAAEIENQSRTTFLDQNDAEYVTKKFFFGAIPVELVENPEGEEHGTVIEAENGVMVGCDDGVFRFNDIVIDTAEPKPCPGNGHDLDPNDDYFI